VPWQLNRVCLTGVFAAEVQTMVEQFASQARRGVYRDDIARFDQALAGLRYPGAKVAANRARRLMPRRGCPDRRAHDPPNLGPTAGLYADFAQVLAGAARTALGHPVRRAGAQSCPDRLTPQGGA
jgi:hypothetical protein